MDSICRVAMRYVLGSQTSRISAVTSKRPGDTVRLYEKISDHKGQPVAAGDYTIVKVKIGFTRYGSKSHVPIYTIDVPKNDSLATAEYFWFDLEKIPKRRYNLDSMTQILLSVLKKAGIPRIRQSGGAQKYSRGFYLPIGDRTEVTTEKVGEVLASRPEIVLKSGGYLIGKLQSGEDEYESFEIHIQAEGFKRDGPFYGMTMKKIY